MGGIIKGLDGMREAMSKSANYLVLKSGESRIIRFITPPDDIISVYEHVEQFGGQWRTITCLGKKECPLCKAGRKPSFKSYFAVIDRNDDNKVKILKVSKKVGVQLLGLIDEYGDLTSRDFKISRQGSKLDTTYQFFPRDPVEEDFSKYELPNIEELVQPLTAEEIEELMQDGAVIADSDEDNDDIGEEDYPF